MRLSLRKNGLDSLFKEVGVLKELRSHKLYPQRSPENRSVAIIGIALCPNICSAWECQSFSSDVFWVVSTPQRAQRSKQINLARNFQSRSKCLISLENFNLGVSISPQIGPRWVARSKISFSLEISNLARNLDFFDLWALWDLCGVSETPLKKTTPHKIGGSRVQRLGFRRGFQSRSVFSELQLQSLVICELSGSQSF